MSSSFRGGFNYFSRSSFNFSKSFFNNKFNLNFTNNSANQGLKFKVNFGNKCFITKLQTLTISQTLSGIVSANSMGGMQGVLRSEADSELGLTKSSTTDALVLLGEVCLIRDDCKWTCATRLASGPHSPKRWV
jgi:hypothetical protein